MTAANAQGTIPEERLVGGERRMAALVVVLLLVASGAVADRVLPHRQARAALAVPTSLAAPADALASTWYCAAGTAAPNGVADGEVIVANPTRRRITGRVTVVPSEGDRRDLAFAVGPADRFVMRPRELVEAPYAATLVELDGGGAVVEHGVSGPLGFDLAPCATTGSSTWYFAEGATTKASSLLLALFNPFPEDAIVDLAFSTEAEGRPARAVPAALQGVVVPPRGLVVQSIGDHVRRREAVSVSVATRSGRLVVEKLSLRNDPGQRGLSLTPGAPRPEPVWHFAEGVADKGVPQTGTTERFHLFNPSTREARVDLELTLDRGIAEPYEIAVAPLGRVTVVANEEDGFPLGFAHAATVRSLNGVPVVVERTLDAAGARVGRAGSLGATAGARSWVLAAGAATDGVDEWVSVLNTSGRAATLRMTMLASGKRIPLDRLGGLRLAPGARRGYRINDAVGSETGSVLVESTEPVVVERALYRKGRTGISVTPGIPLPD